MSPKKKKSPAKWSGHDRRHTMITRYRMTVMALAAALAVACGDPPAEPTGIAPSFPRDGTDKHLVTFSRDRVPANFARDGGRSAGFPESRLRAAF
jgi:hypothetical protein